jgi:hypothetical protein
LSRAAAAPRAIGAALAVLGGLALGAPSAGAQGFSPYSLEVHGGLGAPTGDLSNDGASTGFTLGFNGQVRFNRILAGYAEFDWAHFSSDAPSEDFIEQGFGGGLIATLPGRSVRPFLRAGFVSHQLTLDRLDLHDEQIGYRVGGGVRVPLGRHLSAVPAVTYTAFGLESSERTASHLTADVALRVDL